MNISLYAAAITAHAILWACFAFSIYVFASPPAIQITVLAIGTAIITYSTWQSVRGIHNGEPLGEALCWLWD